MAVTYTFKEVKSLCKKAYDEGFTNGHYDEQEKTADKWVEENIKEKEPKKPKVKRSYKMTVYYMIGDANGNTEMKETISAKNPFLPLVTAALDNLKNVKGRWGMVLDDRFYSQNLEDGNISKSEYNLLSLVSGWGCDEESEEVIDYLKDNGFENNEENIDFLNEFQGLLIDDTEYSFLVYEGYKLK
jgi:hypothetical protein